MAKEQDIKSAAAPVETQCVGRVVGLSATPEAFQFELRGRKSQKLMVAIDPASAFLTPLVVAAFQSGDKLHATLSGSTAGLMKVVQLRLGAKLKTKKNKPLAPDMAQQGS